MDGHMTRTIRRFACIAIAAGLAAPAVADGGTANPTLRNDVAHFGVSAPADRSSATLRNDQAHFGRNAAPSAPNPAPPASSAPIVVRIEEGFDWVSAAVGAVGGLGLVLVAGAGTSALRRRHGGNAAHS